MFKRIAALLISLAVLVPAIVWSQSAPLTALLALNDAVTVNANGMSHCAVRKSQSGANTIVFEGTNDGFASSTNALRAYPASAAVSVTSSTISGDWDVPIIASMNQFRVRMSAFTNGVASVSVLCGSAPPILTVVQPVAGNLNVNATGTLTSAGTITQITTSIVPGTAATNLGKAEDAPSAGGDTGVSILCIRRDVLIANGNVSASGDYIPCITDSFGALWVNDGGYTYANITTNTTTTLKNGAGYLHTFTINTRGTTSAASIYDSPAALATPIATIDTTLSTTAFVYDVAFASGLTINATGASAADLTVTYR